MKKRVYISIFLVCLTLCIMTNCPSPDDSTPEPTANPINETVTVLGRVTNLKTGDPVAGATVTVAGKSVSTNTSGNYSVTFSGDFSNKILNIQTDGYARYSKPLDENQGDEAKLNPALVPVDLIVFIDPTNDSTNIVSTIDGAQVEFPNLSGEGITEDLMVSITHFDVSSGEIASVPGNFTGSDGGVTSPIISQGMLEVVILGRDSGNEYDFQGEGLDFVITLPVTGDPALAEETIDLWWYNADTGLWIKEGTATKTNIDGEEFYVGTVSHFSTWNMDFKMSDVVRIHGTINDSEDDYYDITLNAPGILRHFSMNDHDLMIINMIPNVVVELTIVKRSTGYQNVIVFETIPTSGDIVELGDLLSPDYLSFVYDLSVYQDETDVVLTWTNPTHADFLGLEIEYESFPMLVDSGIEHYAISGFPTGTLEFYLTAIYTDSRESATVIKRVRFGAVAELSIELNIEPDFEDAILQNYSTVEDWYNLYYRFGNNTEYIEYSGPVFLPAQSMQLMIEFDSVALDYEEEGNQYTWDVYTPSWYRDDDYAAETGMEVDIELDSDEDGDDLYTVYFYSCK